MSKHKPRSALTFEMIEELAKRHPQLAEQLAEHPHHKFDRRIVQEFFRMGLRLRWLSRQVRGKYLPHQGKHEKARRVFGGTHNLRLAQRYLVAARRNPNGPTPA